MSPSYEQTRFPDEDLNGKLRLVASPDATDKSIKIHSDARIYLGRLTCGDTVTAELSVGRYGWLQVLRGNVTLNGQTLDTSDAAATTDESTLLIIASSDSEIMLFDLA